MERKVRNDSRAHPRNVGKRERERGRRGDVCRERRQRQRDVERKNGGKTDKGDGGRKSLTVENDPTGSTKHD